MDQLHASISKKDFLLTRLKKLLAFRPSSVRGMYIYGSVGVGKSFLMDLFHGALSRDVSIRVHFHEFMLDVHRQIFELRKHHRGNVVPLVAHEFPMRVLCIDEFMVTDICDAMVLKQLLEHLWKKGVVVVCTSNRAPEDLYEGGINRSLFLPFIDNLRIHCDIVCMDTLHDYRLESTENVSNNYHLHLATAQLQEVYAAYDSSPGYEPREIPVPFGRSLSVHRANRCCAWFNFRDLCESPLGPVDYISLCQHFLCIIVEGVPQLDESCYNEARRFVTLIDAAYDSNTRLVISAAVSLSDLFVKFGDSIPSSPIESTVVGQGGSSSSFATTMIHNKDGGEMEWSATGLTGASLAQLSSMKDVSFSFHRAASRLHEMGRSEWGRRSL